jgi:hypothetical protein
MWPPAEMGSAADVAKPLETAAWIDLGLGLTMTARVLMRTHKALFERIRAEGGEVCMLVSLSPGSLSGFTLPAGACHVFGELGINVEFDLVGD